MALVLYMCLLVPAVLAVETTDGPHKHQPHDITNIAEPHLKDIPSAEISKHILLADKKDKIAKLEKTVDVPFIEIKPLENAIKMEPVNSKLALKKKNKSKLMNRLTRKEKKALRKKNKLRRKQLRKQQKNKKKQMKRRNKLMNQGQKEMRMVPSNKLSDVIKLIMTHHREGEASKLSPQHIERQILDLITDHKEANKVIKPVNKCPKSKIGNRKGRKLLRSLKRGRKQRMRPRKLRVLKGRLRAAVNRGRGRDRGRGNKAGRSKKYVTKGKKGKVGTIVTVRTGNKKMSRRNKKEVLKGSN